MEESTFDHLARAIGSGNSRRRLLGVLTGLGVGGVLSVLDDEAGEARRKGHGRRRSHRPGKKKDNRKGERKGDSGLGGRPCIPVNVLGDCPASGVCGCPGEPTVPCVNGKCVNLGGDQCAVTSAACTQSSDCCSGNCFNFVCAEPVQYCDPATCSPLGTGCCTSGCCYGDANQCNLGGECCAPNCAGKQCGADGCGNGGTCGTCASGQTCDAQTGQCLSPPCGPDTCADGCCDDSGVCQTSLGCTGGGSCDACCGPATCPNGCCDEEGVCQPGTADHQCGTNGQFCLDCEGEYGWCIVGGTCDNCGGAGSGNDGISCGAVGSICCGSDNPGNPPVCCEPTPGNYLCCESNDDLCCNGSA